MGENFFISFIIVLLIVYSFFFILSLFAMIYTVIEKIVNDESEYLG